MFRMLAYKVSECVAYGTHHFILTVLLAAFAAVLFPAALAGQDPETEESEKDTKVDIPLAVITGAGVERLLSNVDYLFESVGRGEIAELVAVQLENVRDFKGIDRSKPFGLMVFLEPGLVPQPVPIGFCPVADIKELMQTVSVGTLQMRKVSDKEELYEIESPRRPLFIRLKDNYAFVTADEVQLDRNFPDPLKVTNQVSNFDIAASANLNNVPEALKSVFLNFLQVSAHAELQQRDNESDAQHQIRKANGESTLEWIELLLTEGESCLIGLDVSEQQKIAAVEVSVKAKPDSKFAKRLQDIAGKRSYFSGLLDEKVALTFSTSWMLGSSGKNTLNELFNAAEGEIATAISEGNKDISPAKGMFDSLRETKDKGHVDFFAQFFGEPPQKFVLIGGLKLEYPNTFAVSLAQVLLRLKSNPEIAELELNVAAHGDVKFHRLSTKNTRRREERLYGSKPSLYVGVGTKAAWFAVGGDASLKTLNEAIDKVAQSKPAGVSRDPHAPFQLTVQIKSWMDMLMAGDPSDFVRAAQKAFSKNDLLRIDFRPTDTGARFRIQFDEGFIRLLGTSISQRIDRRLNGE